MGILERALQLAAEGECRRIEDVRNGLVSEGYLEIDAYLAGFTLHRQLNRALKRGRPGTERDKARIAE